VRRFVYALPEGQEFTGPFHVMDLAPDGSALLYSGVGGLRLRDMATLEERVIGVSDGLLSAPAFSRDGQSIAYLSPSGQIHRLPAAGGPAARVSERVLRGPVSLRWAPDGTILFSDIGGIYRVPATGGTPALIIDAEGEVVFGPRLLPDGDTLLFTRNSAAATPAQAQVIAQSLATGERTVVVDGGVDARYVPTGHIVYLLADTLFGVAFDLETKRVTGGAVPLVQGVSGGLWAQFAIANDGTLAYVRGSVGTRIRERSFGSTAKGVRRRYGRRRETMSMSMCRPMRSASRSTFATRRATFGSSTSSVNSYSGSRSTPVRTAA
jgi:hypothetical protein